MQAFKYYNLASEAPRSNDDNDVDADKDSVLFRPSWSSSTINYWLCSLFPYALTWLDKNCTLADPDTYCWVLLVPAGRSQLTEFFKKGDINGQDLETCRTPEKGKA